MVLRERSLKQGQRLLSPVRWSASSPSAWCRTWIQKLWRSRLALTETTFACNTDDSNTVDTVKHRCFNLFRVFVVDASELNNSLGWNIFSSHLHWQNCLSFFFLISYLSSSRFQIMCKRSLQSWGAPTKWSWAWAMEPGPGSLTSTTHTTWLVEKPWKQVQSPGDGAQSIKSYKG